MSRQIVSPTVMKCFRRALYPREGRCFGAAAYLTGELCCAAGKSCGLLRRPGIKQKQIYPKEKESDIDLAVKIAAH